jgi:hypothetical protein
MFACQLGHLEATKWLLDNVPGLLDGENPESPSALHDALQQRLDTLFLACQSGNPAIVEYVCSQIKAALNPPISAVRN